MKKLTSKEPITFRVDGSTKLEITKAGVLCTDEHANIAAERLGGNVSVEDVKVEDEAEKIAKEAEKEAKKAAKEAEKEAKKADVTK